MKRILSILLVSVGVAGAIVVNAQNKIDEQRMERDIEIAENVLGTLIKQQFGKRNFFPYEVEGNYTPGYGVTFRLPMDFGGSMMYIMRDDNNVRMNIGDGAYSYSIDATPPDQPVEVECDDCPKRVKSKTKGGVAFPKKANNDSLSNAFNQKIKEAAKNFIADYGDLIGQLSPDEKIMITNRHEGQRYWYASANSPKRKFLSLEAVKTDLSQFKSGKLTRDQLLAKISVIDSESSDELTPDLELLTSILNRLFSVDLSKTYYSQDNIYYERLKNYGAIYYFQVYSSNETDFKRLSMPTLGLEDLDQATRDKKVKELYPVFEKDTKESMIDYGRTLKSLGNEELLVFNIKLTKCEGCGIPKTLELSVKGSVLKDFGSGKLTKDAAVGMINVKKGPNQ